MKKEYLLKKYNETLLKFSLQKKELEDYKIEILEVFSSKDSYPIGVEDNSTLLTWLKSRTIPRNRAFVLEIMENQGIEANDLISILDLKFKEKIYNYISPSKYNEETRWWDKIPFNKKCLKKEDIIHLFLLCSTI